MNPSMTVKQLATKLGLPESQVRSRLSKKKDYPTVDWKSYGQDTHFYQMMALLHRMNEDVTPFMDGDKIVVRMSDDYAFIFDKEGNHES